MIEFEESIGNVYADLGNEDAAEMLVKAQLGAASPLVVSPWYLLRDLAGLADHSFSTAVAGRAAATGTRPVAATARPRGQSRRRFSNSTA